MAVVICFGVFGIALWVGALVMVIRNRRIAKKADKRFGKGEFLFMGKFSHVGGLDIPTKVECKVYCLRNRIVIEALGHEYSLPVKRVVDVSIMSLTGIQKQLVSDAGGAVAGGMTLGPLGAMMGGRIQERSILTTNKFLLFTYKSADGEGLKYIVFNATDSLPEAKNFAEAFKPLKKRKKVNIDL